MKKSISITCKTGELIEIAKLERFQGDLKEITTDSMEKLKASIIKYGFSFPIFVWQTKILDGHQRLEASKQLIKEGYILKGGKLPVVQIEADSDQEAAEKLLLINSRYAQITQAGFNADLINCSSWLNKNKKAVRWFLIAGLPTETDEDWTELKDAVLTWKKITPKGVLELSFTAWCPDPATPLCLMPLDDFYFGRFEDFKRWFFDGVGWSNRIKLYAPQKPISRLKKAMASLCIDEKKLYAGGNFGPNDCVNYPYKIASKKLAIKKFDDIPARHPDNDK